MDSLFDLVSKSADNLDRSDEGANTVAAEFRDAAEVIVALLEKNRR